MYENRINELPLDEYFEEFIRRRPSSSGGYVKLPKKTFTNMLKKVQTEAQYVVVKNAFY